MNIQGRKWQKLLGLVALSGVISVGVGLPSFAATHVASSAAVVVNTDQVENTVAETALGINTSVNDGNLFSPGVPARLESLGIRLLRWPGGSFADTFDWETEEFALTEFGQLAQQVHSQAVITVNYGSGTPQLAAAEVKFANTTHHLGIKYWEIGNEQYGDGEYQNNTWEENLRPNKGPAAYAKNVLQFIKAMRAVDPNIEIGVVATIPGVWPSGLKPYWDRTILPIVAKDINFVVLHWYPGGNQPQSNGTLLQDPDAIAGYMQTMHTYLKTYAGAKASKIQIFVDETNGASSSSAQTISWANGLFLAKDYNDWLKDGAANVSWWDLHTEQPNFSTADPGFGILSTGLPGQPPTNDPFPPYFAYRLVHFLVQPGDSYVSATSDQSLLSAYAVTRPNGGLGLMLVNTSPARSFQATYSGLNSRDGQLVTVRSYGPHSTELTTKTMHWTGHIQSAPYTVTEITFPPALSKK